MQMLFKFFIENNFVYYYSGNTLKSFEICMFLKSDNTTLKNWVIMLHTDVSFGLL